VSDVREFRAFKNLSVDWQCQLGRQLKASKMLVITLNLPDMARLVAVKGCEVYESVKNSPLREKDEGAVRLYVFNADKPRS